MPSLFSQSVPNISSMSSADLNRSTSEGWGSVEKGGGVGVAVGGAVVVARVTGAAGAGDDTAGGKNCGSAGTSTLLGWLHS